VSGTLPVVGLGKPSWSNPFKPQLEYCLCPVSLETFAFFKSAGGYSSSRAAQCSRNVALNRGWPNFHNFSPKMRLGLSRTVSTSQSIWTLRRKSLLIGMYLFPSARSYGRFFFLFLRWWQALPVSSCVFYPFFLELVLRRRLTLLYSFLWAQLVDIILLSSRFFFFLPSSLCGGLVSLYNRSVVELVFVFSVFTRSPLSFYSIWSFSLRGWALVKIPTLGGLSAFLSDSIRFGSFHRPTAPPSHPPEPRKAERALRSSSSDGPILRHPPP